MKIEWHPEARNDLERFPPDIQREILNRVGTLRDSPLGENTSLVSKQGLDIFRLKLKNDELDHRVYYDLEDGTIIVLGVEHRDTAYTTESIERVKSRT